jgi:hypothetical protein
MHSRAVILLAISMQYVNDGAEANSANYLWTRSSAASGGFGGTLVWPLEAGRSVTPTTPRPASALASAL